MLKLAPAEDVLQQVSVEAPIHNQVQLVDDNDQLARNPGRDFPCLFRGVAPYDSEHGSCLG